MPRSASSLVVLLAILSVVAGCRTDVLFPGSDGGAGAGGADGGGGDAPCECETGCCSTLGCAPGAGDTACGSVGEQCVDCSAFGQVCNPSSRTCAPSCACGNLVCEPECGEGQASCPGDCACTGETFCGDGACQEECGEDSFSCPVDCQSCACGDFVCSPGCGD
ncbi:MAG: hypothetical protein JNK04_15680, partial [Myxococcales bacterium]|nr:hypothetical protein [Myxococcales bacterium]